MNKNRPLTEAERELALWLLKNGVPDDPSFIAQLENAEVTPWRCQCGCASINFNIKGMNQPPPGINILGDFVFGENDNLAGIFIYESAGILSGIEVYGFAKDAPKTLPSPMQLRHK